MKRKFQLYPILMTILTYLPIAVVVIYSFNESRLSSQWGGFSLKWYRELLRDRDIMNALVNSLLLGALSSVFAAILATSAALGMKNSALPFKNAAEKIALAPLIIPEIVLGMVFLAFFSLLGLPFGMVTLVIAHTAFCVPYIYMQVKARLAVLEEGFTDAARDLGANGPQAFFTVTLPLLAPAILSGMFLSFAMSFDDVIISIFVTGVSVNTLPIRVYTSLKTGVTPEINALCTVMLAVTVLCYILAAAVRRLARK
ncbi:MAG: ABC transporter permease [Clostridia bacterium]|nr:ABC transporter permease [Clostridia bacterium]